MASQTQRISTCKFCLKLIGRRNDFSLRRTSLHQQLPSSASLASHFSTNSKHFNSKSNVEIPVEEEDPEKPYSFSKSKAAHWTVDKSFGSQYSRPWWKVAPLSLSLVALVAWIFLRSETDLDRKLEVNLSERLPDLFPPPEEESSQIEAEDVTKDTR
eukprot:XP_001184408.1 PREDICTED: protein CCSMST1-like [Strongylocentrotus purpuratus]